MEKVDVKTTQTVAPAPTKPKQQPKVVPKSFSITSFFSTPNPSFGEEALKKIVVKSDLKSGSTTVASDDSPVGVMDLTSGTKSVRAKEETPSQDNLTPSPQPEESTPSVVAVAPLTQPIAMSQSFDDVMTPPTQQSESPSPADTTESSADSVTTTAAASETISSKPTKKPRPRAKKAASDAPVSGEGDETKQEDTTPSEKKEVKKRVRKPAAAKAIKTDTSITASPAATTEESGAEEGMVVEKGGENQAVDDGTTDVAPAVDATEGAEAADDGSRPKRVRKAPTYYEPTEVLSTGVFEEIPEDGEDEVMYVDKTDVDADIKGVSEKKSSSESSKKKKAEPAPPVDVLSLLTPEALAKVNSCKDRMAELAKELADLEKLPDLCDENLDLESAYADLVTFVVPPVDTAVSATASSSSSPVAATDAAVEEKAASEPQMTESPSQEADAPASQDAVAATPVEPVSTSAPSAVVAQVVLTPEDYITVIVARRVQGSKLPIAGLVAHVKEALLTATETLSSLRNPVSATVPAVNEDADAMPVDASVSEELSEDAKTRLELLQAELSKLLNSEESLSEKIKCIAERESYKAKAKGPSYAEEDEIAIWRWDVKSLSYFTKQTHAILRDAKSNRGRYRRALKALSKVYEQVIKANDESKLAPLEEVVSAARLDITKAKEKRREAERKKAEEAEAKRLKEEAREAKRKEKEELAAIKAAEDREKKAAAEREKAEREKEKAEKEKIVPEKVLKEREAMEKQKNILSNFFKKPAIATGSSFNETAKTTAVISLDENGAILKEEQIAASSGAVLLSQPTSSRGDAPAVAHANPRVPLVAAQRIVAQYPWQRVSFDQAGFEQTAFSNMSIEDILLANAQRTPYSTVNRTLRKPKTLNVTLTNQSAFGGNAYSENVQRQVDSRMKSLFFHEDYRPAYFGTFSKRSSEITGRRPFEQDSDKLNYEYDSEAEWEEEEEGEDIANSEDNSDDEGDELEYDEFFVQDNDFGSDVGSDGDMVARVAMRIREGEERLGVRYISSARQLVEDVDCGMYVYDGAAGQSTRFNGGKWTTVTASADVDTQRLSSYGAVVYGSMVDNIPTLGEGASDAKEGEKSDAAEKNKNPFDAATIRDLAVFIQGKKDGVDKLVVSFQADHPLVSKAETKRRIVELAERKKHADGYGTVRWVCREDKLASLAAEFQSPTKSQSSSSPSKKWLATVPTVEFTPRKEKSKSAVKASGGASDTVNASSTEGAVTATKPKSGAKSAAKSASKTTPKDAIKEAVKAKAPKPTHNRRTRAAIDNSESNPTASIPSDDAAATMVADSNDMMIGPYEEENVVAEEFFHERMMGGDLAFSPLFDATAVSSPVPVTSTPLASQIQPKVLAMSVEKEERTDKVQGNDEDMLDVDASNDENEAGFSNQGSISSQDLIMLADI